MNYLSDEFSDLEAVAEKYKEAYKSADPFPNIYFDNFFNPDFLDKVLGEFPDLSQGSSLKLNHQHSKKLASRGEQRFGPYTKEFTRFLNSERFLLFLQVLTNMERPLIPDPYFFGGGFHEIKRDGFLKIHADFNKHDQLGIDRRLNILVYLNKDWDESYGGHFELWDKDMKACVKKVPPTFNTLAMFSTTDFSYHGHPNPLTCPPDRSRKSLAMYFYSNGRPAEEVIAGNEVHSTLYKARAGNTADKPSLKYRMKNLAKDLTPPIVFKMLGR